MRKFQKRYFTWEFRYTLRGILKEIHRAINEHGMLMSLLSPAIWLGPAYPIRQGWNTQSSSRWFV